MTTEKNFFVRHDVTGFFTMLQVARGAEWGGDSSPGTGCAGIRAPGAGWGGDSGPGRGVGIIWGKMGNFLPFCRFFAVWVEICISSRLCMILYSQKLIVLYSND